MLETPTHISIVASNQKPITMTCKCKSFLKPTTIKWFKKKDDSQVENTYETFLENYKTIKYFENFYEPMTSLGIKELSDNIYLGKLLLNNVELSSSVFVCVAINYYGFSFKEIFVNFKESSMTNLEDEEVIDFPDKKFEIWFLIPVILLMPTSMLICTIFYLLIKRQMLKRNKIPETIFL